MPTVDDLKRKRDAKARPHLEQYAPVWILQEELFAEDECIQFHVLFQHNLHGWVNRRYRYDGFNDTLYHKGQTLVAEDAALERMLATPYIAARVADIPNSYGG
ncbi:MAG: hypothetical protein OXE95_11090 [Chloroflexi bacterium]|nr:hypothetical protein [Chloroflexota bacterium]MCY4248103.1 hypothetical protein [Chloroflexota bacterium]